MLVVLEKLTVAHLAKFLCYETTVDKSRTMDQTPQVHNLVPCLCTTRFSVMLSAVCG